jgi:hypothetical protein
MPKKKSTKPRPPRNPLVVEMIRKRGGGAGAHKGDRKEVDKKACREPVAEEEKDG